LSRWQNFSWARETWSVIIVLELLLVLTRFNNFASVLCCLFCKHHMLQMKLDAELEWNNNVNIEDKETESKKVRNKGLGWPPTVSR
jgi:hypothetical protein